MQYNTCHNQNIKLIITILQKFSTVLHKLAAIKTKFEFKFKLNLELQTKYTENKETVIVVDRFL
jgi:hypothetical protein